MTDTGNGTLGVADKYYIAARVQSALEATFAHWDDVEDLSSDGLFRELLADLENISSRSEFSLRMMRYLAVFQNAHTEFLDHSLLPYQRGVFPVRLRDLDGKWYVTGSRAPGLAVGDEIHLIDGRPAGEFLADYLPYVAASRPAFRGYGLFMKLHGLPDTLTVTTAGHELSISREPTAGVGPAEVTCEVFADHGVIRIPSFDDEAYEDSAICAIRELADKRFVILDLRGNGGGETPVRLIEELMDRPYPGWVEASSSRTGLELAETFQRHEGRLPVGQTPRSTISWTTGWHQPGDSVYAGGLAILTDIGCKSATEDFIMPFAATKRALIVGETTAGSSGQPYSEQPFPGLQFTIGAKRQYFPDMRPFEGHGIAPDVPVDPLEALRSDHDLHLSTAVKIMTE